MNLCFHLFISTDHPASSLDNTTFDFQTTGESPVSQALPATARYGRPPNGLPLDLSLFHLGSSSFLDEDRSLVAQKVSSGDVVVATDQQDPEIISAVATRRIQKRKTNSLDWIGASLELVKQIPVVGKPLSKLLEGKTRD